MASPRFKKWTREAYVCSERVVDLDRYELIEGDLLAKARKSHAHSCVAMLMREWLWPLGDCRVVLFGSVNVAAADNLTSWLEPDLVILRRSLLELRAVPGPEDTALVAEISEATLTFDLTIKRDLYARAPIAEYWVVDVQGRRVVVHRDPVAGRYQSIAVHHATASLAPLSWPNHVTVVNSLFAFETFAVALSGTPLSRKQWTQDEYLEMKSLVELDRYELVDGELVGKIALLSL